MELIPYKQKIIISSLSMTKTLLELENLIEPRRLFLNIRFCNTTKPFKGYIKGNYFKIKMSHMNTKLGNFSPPIIIGKVREMEKEISITLNLRPCFYEVFFLIFLIGSILTIFYNHFPWGLIILPILLIVYMMIVFNYYSKKSLEILYKHFNSKS